MPQNHHKHFTFKTTWSIFVCFALKTCRFREKVAYNYKCVECSQNDMEHLTVYVLYTILIPMT